MGKKIDNVITKNSDHAALTVSVIKTWYVLNFIRIPKLLLVKRKL